MGVAEFGNDRDAGEGSEASSGMLKELGKSTRDWARRYEPCTNVYGLARSLIAIGSASTLATTSTSALFHPVLGAISSGPTCDRGPGPLGLFCLLGEGHLEIARWLAVAGLLLVASGWRPRLTGVLHWWLSLSFFSSATLADGGDQISVVLSALLLPVTLCDGRRWHWQSHVARETGLRDDLRRLVALAALFVIRVQVAGVYMQASVAKFSVQEWADGTALYYWASDPTFGASPWLLVLLAPIMSSRVLLTAMTWGAMAFEYLLSAALVMPKRAWGLLLVPGILFHFAIALMHGLPSFSIAMFGALVLYLRPVEMRFHWVRVPLGVVEEVTAMRAGLVPRAR